MPYAMKRYLTTLTASVFIATTYAQTAATYLQSGIEKHNAKDYKGAIADYTQAIAQDKTAKNAWFNRGVCELALEDFKAAKADFDKTIQLDATDTTAYYDRAATFVRLQQYKEAVTDLNKVLELAPTLTNALLMRGQIKARTGDRIGGCEDLSKAKELGDDKADKYISQFCGNEQQKGESLALDWPDDEHWKVGDNQEDGATHVVDLIHEGETVDNWTELGNMMSIKGVTGVPVDTAMQMMYRQSKVESAKAKLTFLEKDENATNPWILFTIESPSFKNDAVPESQLWYVVQGKQGLYTNFRAIKKATISPALIAKWSKFFKAGRVVYQ